MKAVLAELKRYNANSDNRDVGDCVKRSLSLAFGEDYNAVGSELNAIKRKYGYSAFNETRTFTKYLNKRGVRFIRIKEDRPTVDEFSKQHPTGTWLCLTGRGSSVQRGASSHILCIIDGDVYDSWNSLGDIVTQYALVSSNTTEFPEVSMSDVLPEILNFVHSYAEKLQSKFKWGTISFDRSMFDSDHIFEDENDIRNLVGYIDKYTFQMYLFVKLGDVPKLADYYSNRTYGRKLIIKLNPKFDTEKNIDALKPKLKQRIYDYVYAIRKDCDDAEAAEQLEDAKVGYYDLKKLMLLPAWCRNRITYFNDYGNSDWGYRFEVEMDALEDDPRAGIHPTVRFEGDTLKELKHNIEWYRTDFARVNYDY